MPPGDYGSARHAGQLGHLGDNALQSQKILIGVPADHTTRIPSNWSISKEPAIMPKVPPRSPFQNYGLSIVQAHVPPQSQFQNCGLSILPAHVPHCKISYHTSSWQICQTAHEKLFFTCGCWGLIIVQNKGRVSQDLETIFSTSRSHLKHLISTKIRRLITCVVFLRARTLYWESVLTLLRTSSRQPKNDYRCVFCGPRRTSLLTVQHCTLRHLTQIHFLPRQNAKRQKAKRQGLGLPQSGP